MAPSSQSKRAGVTAYLAPALLTALVVGVVWLRLREDGGSPTSMGMAGSGRTSGSTHGPRAGDVAPDFTLENLDGQPVTLSEWRGRPVLVNFWAPWCKPCELEMPAIQAAYEAHQEHGFVVLAVAVDDSAENVRRFFVKHDLTFEPLMDDGSVSHVYQVLGLPTSVFVGSDGTISAVHIGPLTEVKIAEYLSSLD